MLLVRTLNGILFYANIVTVNAETYFLAPNFVTVFISYAWLNLDIGFDVCFFTENKTSTFSDVAQSKLHNLGFSFSSLYVIFLVIIVMAS